MFQSEKDLAVRCALFAAAQVPMYIREYHMRFKFLMNKFGPGNRLEKEKVSRETRVSHSFIVAILSSTPSPNHSVSPNHCLVV